MEDDFDPFEKKREREKKKLNLNAPGETVLCCVSESWKICRQMENNIAIFESSSGQIADFIGEVREFFLNRKTFCFALANNVHGNRHFF
jgi:hypothetical protein